MATSEETFPESWFESPLPDFDYAPLPDPATHIRLLEIATDRTIASCISIIVSVTPLDSAPPYHAVSYTRGIATHTRELLILDGVTEKRMIVGMNCADVLQQLAHFKITKYYWVDAICINQADAKEKGYQVGMMGEIFSRAECVLACLGMQQNDNKFLVDMLNNFDNFLSDKRHYQYSAPTEWHETSDNFMHSAQQSPQNQVLVVEGGVQVTRDGPWTHEAAWEHDGQYTRILGPNGMVNGVASAGVQVGDWLVPMSRCYGVVLRQSVGARRYYDIVGRLFWTSLSMPATPGLTAFMIWFGVEDLLVHIVCCSPFFLEYNSSDELGEGLDWALSIPFCAEPRSSFAEIPMKPRQWSKEEFRMGGESIQSAMLEDWRRKSSGQQSNVTARPCGG